MRPMVVNEAAALVIESRTAHLHGPAGDGIDGGQRFEERVLPGKCAFLFQDVELLVRFGDDAFSDGGGDPLQSVTDMESVEERDVENPSHSHSWHPAHISRRSFSPPC